MALSGWHREKKEGNPDAFCVVPECFRHRRQGAAFCNEHNLAVKICQGHQTSGRKCEKPTRPGKDYCKSHDPERIPEGLRDECAKLERQRLVLHEAVSVLALRHQTLSTSAMYDRERERQRAVAETAAAAWSKWIARADSMAAELDRAADLRRRAADALALDPPNHEAAEVMVVLAKEIRLASGLLDKLTDLAEEVRRPDRTPLRVSV